MALKECVGCKKKILIEANVYPVYAAPAKNSFKDKPIHLKIFLYAILACFSLIGGVSETIANTSKPSVYGENGAIDESKAVRWISGEVSDEMTDAKRPYLYNTSLNGADFDFPYRVEGGSKATLVIRKDSNNKVAFISVEKGHMICSYNDCSILIRDESGKVTKWSASKPQVGVTNTLFINDVRSLEKIIKENEKIRIGVEFYRYGIKSFDFNVSGYPGL